METLDHLRATIGDRYTFDRVIGRGGMATVYLAEERHPRRQVAVKVLTEEFASQPMRQRFLREVDLASKLIHPHIVPVYAAGEAGTLLYYVMPYIDGESLRQRLKRVRALPLAQAIGIAREVAQALHYAHELGVIHRDVKPENILLTDAFAMVTDFGIARAIGAAGGPTLTQTGLPIGTPAYMSPEQWTATDVDRRCDVYSLGCVLLECVGGDIRNTNPVTRVDAVRGVLARTPDANRATGGLITALERALAPNPDDRLPTAAAFAEAIAREDDSVPPLIATLPARRVSLGWIAAAAAVLALISGIFLTSRGSSSVPGRVAVAPFENQTGDPALSMLGPMAADWITQGLAQTGLVEVVGTRTALSAREAEARGRDPVRVLAEETGASVVVSGAYYLQGPVVQFQARITDAAEMKVLRALAPVSGPRDSALATVETVRQRVMGALATLFDDRLSSWAQVTAQPPSFEAYEEYILGLTLFMRLRIGDGLDHLYRAASLDSAFGTPLVFAAFAHSTQNEWAKAESLAQAVNRRRDGLPPFERHLVDWVLEMTKGDWEGALSAVREAAQTAPGSEALSLVGLTALGANRPQETLDAFGQLEPDKGLMRGFFLYWSYITNALHKLGDHEAELAAARRGLAQYPDHPYLLGDEILALAALGRLEEMAARLAVRARLPARPQMLIGDEFRVTALELARHGYDSAAADVLRMSTDWFRALPPVEAVRAPARYGLARSLYAAGTLDEAEALLEDLAREEPDSLAYPGYLAVIAARRGNRARADELSRRLERAERPYLFGAIPFWRARIAAVLGDSTEAIAQLEQALREGRGFDTDDQHFNVDFQPLHGYAPFEALLAPKGD